MLKENESHKFKVIICLTIVSIITFFAFLPAVSNGFVNFDDDIVVTRNYLIRDFSWSGIKQIFDFNNYKILYTPLVFLSYLIENHFFGLSPFVFHLDNLLLHIFNCLLVFWLIFTLNKNIFTAFLTAIFFGVHPLRVESVTWITERKDVLCAFFFLGALISYIYYTILIANYSIIFYLCKLLLPIRLSCLYPYPLKIAGLLPSEFFLSSTALIILFFSVKSLFWHRKELIFGSLFFFIAIFPALQFLSSCWLSGCQR